MGSNTKKHKRERDMSRKYKHKSRSRSPREREPEQQRDKGRENRRENVREIRQKRHYKDRRHRHDREGDREEYHSDSSDVVEVPIVAPPAPSISRPSRSPSPIPDGGAGDCLSIDETNKLRAKLGLKPLETDTGPTNSNREGRRDGTEPDLNQYKDDYGEFYHKPADNISDKTQAEKIREKLREKKEKRKQESKLNKVRVLGGSDDETDNIANWVEKSREKEKMKKEADKRAKMLEEMDAEFGVSALVEQETRNTKRDAYKGKDLRGMRVEHDMENFSEGREIILTLKDKEILAEDDDTLINVNMIDDERYKKNIENKKTNPNLYGYNVYADENIDEFGQVVSRPILGKYDDEIDGGTKATSFTIGESVNNEMAQKRKMLEIRAKLNNQNLHSLDTPSLQLASEYYTEQEMTSFKKPKRKVKKIRQKLKADDLLEIAGESSTSAKDLGSRKRRTKTNLDLIITDDTPQIHEDLTNVKFEEDEDDDLQFVLSKARRLKQKEALITKPLLIQPSTYKPEVKSEPTSDDDDEDGMAAKDANIVLDATAEFCRTLGDIPTYGLSGNRDEEVNDLMDFEHEMEEPEQQMEEEPSNIGTWSSVNPDAAPENLTHTKEFLSDVAILDEEPDVSSGVAGALRLAMSKGYLEKDENNRPSGGRMAHLQAKNYSIEDKTYGDDDKFGRRERYQHGPTVDFKEKDLFKPNVKLEYIDDGGRLLNAKEAFRYLSHKFHGKGPGKNKIEKRLKKQEQDTLMMKMNSTDTPLGTLNMLQLKQKETQSPYIVLSGSKQAHATTMVKSKLK